MVPSISIIIPVFNKETYLSECLNSIISQLFFCYEVILVDDGSTDDSAAICDKYAERYQNIVVFHTENHGVSAARNVGLDNANGDYILFVDPDDLVSVDYLETIVDSIGGFDLLFFSNSIFYKSGGINYYQLGDCEVYGHNETEKYIYSLKTTPQGFEFFGYIWNKCYKREIIDNYHIRFCEGLSMREDNVFNEYYYSKINNLKAISNALYRYRYSEDGLTHRIVSQREYLLLAQEYEKFSVSCGYNQLRSWNIQRTFNFLMKSSLPFSSTQLHLFCRIRKFVKAHTEVADSIKYKLYFRSFFPIACLLYYAIEGFWFLKNSIKRWLVFSQYY